MDIAMKFRETQLVQDSGSLRLLDLEGNVLLELRGDEIEEAVRAGFLDTRDYHFSMYAYARLRKEYKPFRKQAPAAGESEPVPVRVCDPVPSVREELDREDNEFLASLGICWSAGSTA